MAQKREGLIYFVTVVTDGYGIFRK